MKQTSKERKQALYDATTKARSHFLAVEKKVRDRVKREHPELEWYERMELEEKDPERIAAESRLLALCDACNIMGIECGE